MGDIKINPILEQAGSASKKEHGLNEQKKQVEKLESRIKTLLQQRNSLDVSEAMSLRNEAASLDRMADYTEEIAKHLEENKKDLEKKSIEEVREVLMAQLGIPAEFVDQLGILVKAGPEALKEAAGVYRAEAQRRREQADILTMEVEKIDREIKELNHVKEAVSDKNATTDTSMKNFLAEMRYKEAIRDKSDLALKEMLQEAELRG